jgi:uncharacterized protein YukE
MASVGVAVEAMLHDATMWDQTSQVTRQAGQEAGALVLDATELSWASRDTGLLSTYAEIQQKVSTLLDEASKVYRQLSVTLDQVGYDYRLHDEDAARRLKGVWDVGR